MHLQVLLRQGQFAQQRSQANIFATNVSRYPLGPRCMPKSPSVCNQQFPTKNQSDVKDFSESDSTRRDSMRVTLHVGPVGQFFSPNTYDRYE